MKSYTDLEQSKKLAEFLSLDTADQCFLNDGTAIKAEISSYAVAMKLWKEHYIEIIPCWSLAALLKLMPKQFGRYTKSLYWFDDAWHCEYVDEDSEGINGTSADNPVDACYEMIIELKELNSLRL